MILTSKIVRVLGTLVVLVSYGQCPARIGTPSGSKQSITVKIRNGKTGLPIWLASPYVYVGNLDVQHQSEAHRKTKLWEDARVDVISAQPRTVRVVVDFVHRDCRYAVGDGSLSAVEDFNLEEVLSTGVVAPNLCSPKRLRPEPGVLTIYVIPATFRELWNE